MDPQERRLHLLAAADAIDRTLQYMRQITPPAAAVVIADLVQLHNLTLQLIDQLHGV